MKCVGPGGAAAGGRQLCVPAPCPVLEILGKQQASPLGGVCKKNWAGKRLIILGKKKVVSSQCFCLSA